MPTPLFSSAGPLDTLLRQTPRVWRGYGAPQTPARSTGFAELDARLPGGGWPIGALIEIAPVCEGLGELQLLLPLLRTLSHQQRHVWLAAPPHIPYAPALARSGVLLDWMVWIDIASEPDALWSAEQVLRESTTGAVLMWSAVEDARALRRLQLAAETGKTFAVLYKPLRTLRQHSPAALRMALYPDPHGIKAELLKVRGGRPSSIVLPLPTDTP